MELKYFSLLDKKGCVLETSEYVPTYWYALVRDYKYKIKIKRNSMKTKEEYFTIIKEIEEGFKKIIGLTPYLKGAMYEITGIPVDIFEEIADHYAVFTTYDDLQMQLETILYCDFGIKIYLYSEKCEKIQETKYIKI